jgi:hypothetical protein
LPRHLNFSLFMERKFAIFFEISVFRIEVYGRMYNNA